MVNKNQKSEIAGLPQPLSAGEAQAGEETAFLPQAGVGRRQRKATETRIRIFRAALGLIAERGLENVTVEAITEAADVGKGTFFNYFPTKDHVMGVLTEIQAAKVSEAVQKTLEGGHSIHDVMAQMAGRLAEEPGRSPALARAVVSSFLASEAVRKVVREAMGRAFKTAAVLIEVGQQRGEIDPSLEGEQVASLMMRSFMGTVLTWTLHEQPPLSVWMNQTFEHFWRSIAADGGKKAL